jgi:hypothetical protein
MPQRRWDFLTEAESMIDQIPETDRTPDTDGASIPDQFMAGETIVEGYAGGRAGTGKTTRLIEWVRAQHDDDAVRLFIDPAAETRPETVDRRKFTPVSIDSRHATDKYSVTGEQQAATENEEEAP